MASRKRYLELEAQAEMKAVLRVGGTSFEDVLRFNVVLLAYSSVESVKNRKGEVIRRKEVMAYGRDVANRKTWDRFIKYMKKENMSLVSLTDNLDDLSEAYYTFLVDFYTPSDRYHNLDMQGRLWLRKVIRLAVEFRLMENKVTAYKQVQAGELEDDDQICQPMAAYLYELLQAIKQDMSKTASLIHKIVNLLISENDKDKRAEIAAPLINQFYAGHYEQLRQTPFPQRDTILRLVQFNPDKDNDDPDTGVGAAI